MKIVVVHNFYQQAGGEKRVFFDETRLLAERGHDVATFTRHNDEVQNYPAVKLAASTVWNRSAARELAELVRTHAADIVHFHNTLPLISPAAYRAARRTGAAVVQTLHNFRLVCPAALLLRDGKICEDCLGKRFPWPAVQHACYRGSRAATSAVATMLATHRTIGTYRNAVDAYIAMTNFSREKLIAGGLPMEKMHVLPNFVAGDSFPGPGDGGYAFYLGRLSSEKGVEVLVDAWKQLGDRMPLKIAGGGPLEAELRSRTADCSNIEMLGRIEDEEVNRRLREATLLILPSVNYEGCPKTILEAYAAGTPIIASQMGGMAELIIDGETGTHFEPGNPTDLAAKASELLDAPERLRQMRVTTRARFDQCYTADVHYEGLMEIYKQALARRGTADSFDVPNALSTQTDATLHAAEEELVEESAPVG